MNTIDTIPKISLLWPPGVDPQGDQNGGYWGAHALADLGLDKVVNLFSTNSRYSGQIKAILLSLCQDPEVIRYRQDIIADLLSQPGLVTELEALQPLIGQLSAYRTYKTGHTSKLGQLSWRLGELEIYVDCVQKLKSVLTETGLNLRATGLCRLRDLVKDIAAEASFQRLVEELPVLMAQLRQASSVTIGVNLDAQLRPEAATLLAINDQKFSGESLLSRLFGYKAGENEFQGLTPLYSKSGRPGEIPMYDLFRDLDRIFAETARTLASALSHYTRIRTGFLASLAPEFMFYINAVKLIRQIRDRGLPMCRPEIAPQPERVAVIADLYDLNLALRLSRREAEPDLSKIIVTNDITFGATSRIFILTGPNQGGKTTYTQAVGLAQVLFQAGLYIPGSQARISPVDGVFTHFPAEEQPGLEAGRFGEEARRLHDIFQGATRHSLILLNESLASTSEGESLYVAQDIVRALRILGARAIFATHLHALAERVADINADTPGDSTLISLVAGLARVEGDEGPRAKRTYKIEPGPPRGISYARDIASQYGISLEKILQTLEERQVIGNATERVDGKQ